MVYEIGFATLFISTSLSLVNSMFLQLTTIFKNSIYTSGVFSEKFSACASNWLAWQCCLGRLHGTAADSHARQRERERKREKERERYIHTHVYIYIYLYKLYNYIIILVGDVGIMVNKE